MVARQCIASVSLGFPTHHCAQILVLSPDLISNVNSKLHRMTSIDTYIHIMCMYAYTGHSDIMCMYAIHVSILVILT